MVWKHKIRDGLVELPMLKTLANSTVGATALGREARSAIPSPVRHAGSLTSVIREILVFKSLSINPVSKRISHMQLLSGFSDSSRSPVASENFSCPWQKLAIISVHALTQKTFLDLVNSLENLSTPQRHQETLSNTSNIPSIVKLNYYVLESLTYQTKTDQ